MRISYTYDGSELYPHRIEVTRPGRLWGRRQVIEYGFPSKEKADVVIDFFTENHLDRLEDPEEVRYQIRSYLERGGSFQMKRHLSLV